VDQLAWRRVALELAVFGGVLLLGRLVVGDDSSPWLRVVVVVVAIGSALAVRRRRPHRPVGF
jgi:hypothetical protein